MAKKPDPTTCGICRNPIGPGTDRCWGIVGRDQFLTCSDCMSEDAVWLMGGRVDDADTQVPTGPFRMREQEGVNDQGDPVLTLTIEGPGAPDIYGAAQLWLGHAQSPRIRDALRSEYSRATDAANVVFALGVAARTDSRTCRCGHSLGQHYKGKCVGAGCGCLFFRDPEQV